MSIYGSKDYLRPLYGKFLGRVRKKKNKNKKQVIVSHDNSTSQNLWSDNITYYAGKRRKCPSCSKTQVLKMEQLREYVIDGMTSHFAICGFCERTIKLRGL